MEKTYLLLGSNLGDREVYLASTRQMLAELTGIQVVAKSSIYVTKPVEVEEVQPNYLNQALKIKCDLTPEGLLAALENIETTLGRTGKGDRRSRTIDIDILLMGEIVYETENLTIPHPRLLERAFTLVPLLELAPEIVHPVTGRRIAEALEAVSTTGVRPLENHAARRH